MCMCVTAHVHVCDCVPLLNPPAEVRHQHRHVGLQAASIQEGQHNVLEEGPQGLSHAAVLIRDALRQLLEEVGQVPRQLFGVAPEEVRQAGQGLPPALLAVVSSLVQQLLQACVQAGRGREYRGRPTLVRQQLLQGCKVGQTG